ncbi:MAG: hypothetical protein IK008_01095 [Bacteroidales bacterium]|nr:hypothetical protein [Bacteroidales bacterium]
MKKIALFLILSLGCFVASAQDLVTRKDGSDIKAKVIEVSPSEVKYKAWDNQDGPTFVLPASDVLIIRFENGSNYVMNSAPAMQSASVAYFTNDPAILGQEALKYRYLKSYYNKSDFDKLRNPKYGLGYPWFNLLVPGLSQYLMSEPGLGTRYLLMYMGSIGIMSAGYIGMSSSVRYNSGSSIPYVVNESAYKTGRFFYLLGGAAELTVIITSIVNAYSVAKIKSLYLEDVNNYRKSYSFSLTPTVLYASTPTGFQPAPGFGLRVTF